MQRFEETTTTVYEIRLPAHSLGVDSFTSGYTFGFAICVNDGDSDGTGSGQKGTFKMQGEEEHAILGDASLTLAADALLQIQS